MRKEGIIMKRILAFTVALLMIVCSLAACGGSDNGGSSTSVVLSDLMNDINSQYGVSDLKVLDKASDLTRYYRIEEADVKQFAAEMSTSSSQFTEVIMVEATDSSAAERVATALNNHLDTQVNTAKSYTKDVLEMIESRKVMTSGNFVYLVISDNADAIEAAIAAKIK